MSLLRKLYGLLRIVLGLRAQPLGRGQVTEFNQGADLLRFVADRACCVERLLKLRARVVILANAPKQDTPLSQNLVNSFHIA